MPNRKQFPEYEEALRKQDIAAAEDTFHILSNLPPRAQEPDAPMTLENMAWYINQRHGGAKPAE